MPRSSTAHRTPPARLEPTRNLHRRAPEPGQTKTARLAYERLMGEVRDLEYEDLAPFWIGKHIPEAWDTLERDVDVAEKKVRVTLLLDESVAKFYRGMGQGYQARINRVLATFAQMRIAQVNAAEARIAKFRAEERARLRGEGG
ncbi:hypothetical protein DKT77_15395 [Meridianimarinicoccus roseus]|uniref:BrnA antitoxin of type II toxin-antitoxin system n=1 Tax=Meridianimarinicoccus roseus TaxID=2072018 RepID=A0A2V2LE69_9RHOB|nr:BrnA antitoxin family protein [Meridianimarinicoccus roseus]PWR01527.1 hypothetical protein DKT77_15395 [Meridianimarinicoccus roseus]